MDNTRSARRTSLLKRVSIKFFASMLVFGVLPISQTALTPVTQAADSPQIESEKFASNVNASKATYEVGDTVSYTIRTRTVVTDTYQGDVVNDTYLENLTISDTLPAGLQYVPGSLKVDGMSVTDAQDSDAGYSVSGEVYGLFGDVQDLNWHTLEFKAVIQAGQEGKTIQNTALVNGSNIAQPDEPTEIIVVGPRSSGGGSGGGGGGSHSDDNDDDDDSRSPILESEKSADDVNGGSIEVNDTIEYTIRARNTVSNSSVTNMVISDDLPQELEYVPGTLKVDGVTVTDADDSDKGEFVNGTVTGNIGTVTDTAWHTLVFKAKVAKGAKGDKIENIGKVSGDNVSTPGKPSEEITIGDGSGSNPGVPEDPNNGTTPTNPGNPKWGDSDSGSSDSGQSGGSDGSGNSGESGGSGQSGNWEDPVNEGSSGYGEGTGSKLPETATNMYGYVLAGFIILLAGLFLLRRKKA